MATSLSGQKIMGYLIKVKKFLSRLLKLRKIEQQQLSNLKKILLQSRINK